MRTFKSISLVTAVIVIAVVTWMSRIDDDKITLPDAVDVMYQDLTGSTIILVCFVFWLAAYLRLRVKRRFESVESRVGIGGWLILPATASFINPIFKLIYIFRLGSNDNDISEPALKVLISEILISIVLTLGWIIAVNSLIRRQKRFPQLLSTILWLEIAAVFLDYFVFAEELGLNGSRTGRISVAQHIVVGTIWIPYMIASSRVKGTFVR